MKLAVISNWTGIGGGEICLLRCVERQDSIESIFLLPEGDFSAWAVSTGQKVLVLRHLVRAGHDRKRFWWIGYFSRYLAANLEVLRFVRRGRVDLLLGNGIGGAVYCVLPSLLAGRPFAWIHHNVYEGGLELRVARILARAARKVIAVSHASASTLFPGSGAGSIEVIHNGIDMDRFAVGEPPPGPVRLALVGRICPIKGHHLLLQAATKLAEVLPEGSWKLEFIGSAAPEDRGYEESLKATVMRSDLGKAVGFPGSYRDPRDIYSRVDVLVCCSTVQEAFPTSVIEAMAAGKLVVGFASGGLVEQVIDGETGFLVAPGDANGLAEALARSVSEYRTPALERMRRAARSRCEELFDIRRTRKLYADVLRAAARKRRAD